MPNVLITGANRGIGLEFARQYSADGWQVIATVRQPGDELAAPNIRVEQLDMTDYEAVVSLGERVDGPLDLVIANAGTWLPESSQTAEDGRAWSQMLAANCIGPTLLARALAPKLAAPGGKLIGLSSGMGSIGETSSTGYLPYRTSKAALNMAWRTLAIEYRPQGLITAVFDPGWVKTRMGGPNAPVTPESSVTAMRAIIDRLTLQDSGGFFRRSGEQVPW
jgi:NAD(P)-dependent dehydrogenase (short-subunit alcohol dehydrogenase family)